ncbi:stage 0 sporulation protein [candidate division WOR-3 bacterium]|uniref:Stage 0 sporulation protein n=1 Tax=candidate division TA06 bacterium TaxID=2250710 RepID=A0A660S9R1_UNCT6|nr:stage 0 sporulation protein [candidate division WOR-3 bacterium]RKX67518.1 MAG: stage 0 sporulation protein [candidate division TA06 bacterium]
MIIKINYHIYHEKFHSEDRDIGIGHYIVFKLDKSTEIGKVENIYKNKNVKTDGYKSIKIIRIANDEDIQQMYENKSREKDSFIIFKEKIKEHNLPMKPVDAELEFDRKRITFFFTAENRIDFRQLVKDLAAIFKIRIELRQIGVRDYAKRLGGIGPCGRPFCCISFLHNFAPITLQVAKEQQVNLNPQKLSGACGRLMCCLAYEYDFYKDANTVYPQLEETIVTKSGKVKVISKDIFSKKITVRDNDGNVSQIDLDEYMKYNRKRWNIFPARRSE